MSPLHYRLAAGTAGFAITVVAMLAAGSTPLHAFALVYAPTLVSVLLVEVWWRRTHPAKEGHRGRSAGTEPGNRPR